MKANEFVKLRGISYCKELLIKADGCAAIRARENNSRVSVDDLKRLIESHDLVSSFGGIKRAKRILKKSYMSFSTMVSVVWNDKPFQCTLEQLEQAIADVESCNVD